MNANNIISDPAQGTVTWVDANNGSKAYLGKAYNETPDSNAAVEINLVEAGTYQVVFNAYDLNTASFDGTLAEAKQYAENSLFANGNVGFVVNSPATLTGLNEDGTTLAFSVKSTDTWTFSSDVAWATADVNSGAAGTTAVTVTIADNAGAARTGVLTFTNGVVTLTFAIGQALNA
jgi:hypothetical protein